MGTKKARGTGPFLAFCGTISSQEYRHFYEETMTETVHRTIRRDDYAPPDYLVDTVELRFELGEETTLVRSRLAVRANYDSAAGMRPLVLDGRRFVLTGLSLDGQPLPPERYT